MCPIVPTFTCGLLRSNFSFAIASPQSSRMPDSGVCLVVTVSFAILRADFRSDFLNPLQVKLAHERLIGNGQRGVQLLRGLSRLCGRRVRGFKDAAGQHFFKLANLHVAALHFLQKAFQRSGGKDPLNGGFQLLELPRFLNFDPGLLKCHFESLSLINLWSGRRESNPRPTAWKAVTLPLSYSRQFPIW